jgi:chromosome segregation ATPase
LRKELFSLRNEINQNTEAFHRLSLTNQALNSQVEVLKESKLDLENQVREAAHDVTQLEDAHEQLQKECRQRKSEFSIQQSKILGLTEALHTLTEKYQDAVDELQRMGKHQKELIQVIQVKENQILELEQEEERVHQQIHHLTQHHTTMSTKVQMLESKLKDYYKREESYLTQIKQADDRKDELRDECDRLVIVHQESESKTEEMKKLLDQIMASSVSKRDHDRMEHAKNDQLEQLQTEIKELTEQGALLTHQMERALRDKRSVDDELKRLQQASTDEAKQTKMIVDELNQKYRTCDRERHDLLQNLDR